MRRSRARATALLLAAASVLFTTVAQSPAAAADLHFTVRPKRVVINQAYEKIPWSVAGAGVGNLEGVNVTLEHVATREYSDSDYAFFPDDMSGEMRISDYERAGRYQVYGDGYDADYNDVAIAPTFVTVKFAARVRLRAGRDGRRVHLRAVTKRYDGGYPRWVGDRGAVIKFQRHVRGHWRTFDRARVNRRGITDTTTSRRRSADYRVVISETKTAWGDVSRAVTR